MPDTKTITTYRRALFCGSVSGAVTTAIPPITHVAFGNGGVDSDGDPMRPSESQTDVSNRIGIYPVASVTYPLDPAPRTTARYVVEIPAGDLGGERINEAALIDADGGAHVIITFYDQRKNLGVSKTFTFNDIF